MYAIVFALFAFRPWNCAAPALALGASGLAIGLIGLVEL